MATNIIDCYVKLPSGRTVSFNLVPTDEVNKVYDRVAEEEGVSVDRVQIKYTGKVLNRSHTLGYLGVCKETILKAEIIQIKRFTIYVKLESGRTVSCQIDNVSPVRYIKEYVEAEESIDIDKQVLKLSGHEIKNSNQKCMDAGITDEAVLELSIQEPPPKEKKASDTDDNNMLEADKEAVLSTFDAGNKPVEVVFSFDTTGSMYSCLEQVRDRLKDTVTRLLQQIASIRVGIIAHGDYCDHNTYVLRSIDLTSDVDTLVDFVANVQSTGGGDAPECYEWVLRQAAGLDWSEDSAKALVVIGDDKPHVASYTDQHVNWHDELDRLIGMGVKVYGVRALNSTESAPFYQELSERSGGAYITFDNFSIIADMFLAVCYREAGGDQFADFRAEVEAAAAAQEEAGSSKMDTPKAATAAAATSVAAASDVKKVLDQIELSEEQRNQNNERPQRYVSAPWWDPSRDNGSPQYSYDQETDTWKPMGVSSRGNSTASYTFDTSGFHHHVTLTPEERGRFAKWRKSRSNRLKKSCSVM